MTPGADAVMSAARPERSGEAAAIQETSFELGAGLGVAVLGTVMAFVHRTTMPSIAGLAPDEQVTAGESFAAAKDLGSRLPPTIADGVTDAARQAYGHGFAVVAVIATIVLVVIAVLAAVLLRAGKGHRVWAGNAAAA
ncbi:hypothetical protein [Streptomyces sp. NPDC088789]|uniref:hypothetical protein n=1 Tax=Streptomyces sp. NPDC088789 TaxID=3365899 RepID=UPI00381B7A05